MDNPIELRRGRVINPGIRQSQLINSFSCPNILEIEDPPQISTSLAPSSFGFSPKPKRRGRCSSPILVPMQSALENPFTGLSRDISFKGFWKGKKKRGAEVLPLKFSKYPPPAPLRTRRKSRETLLKVDDDDDISCGPSPVCIVITRSGDESVSELEETDGGQLKPTLSKKQLSLKGLLDQVS